MYILGISAYYHDSGAVVINDGEVIAAAQEERFTRKKHDPAFPANAVSWCLDYAGIGVGDLSAVVFYDKPFLKFERLLETYYAFAPRGLKSFISAIPVWIKDKLFLKKVIQKELRALCPDGPIPPILFPEHHLSHAASAFYPSPFLRAAVLTIDGVGEWATATIAKGDGKGIRVLKELHFPHSVGLLYSAFTYYCGFKVNSGEYKLMGLAPYGDPGSERTKRFVKLIQDEMVDLKPDGSVWLNMDYFDYAAGLTMTADGPWERLFGIPRRLPESEITQPYMDLSYAVQQVTEEAVMRMAREAKRLTGEKDIVLAGGVALNCVANGVLLRSGLFDEIWIQPAAGDAGGALGAALAAWHLYFDKDRTPPEAMDAMKGSYLGPEFSGLDIEKTARKYAAPYRRFEDCQALCREVAGLIDQGQVIGWSQGRMEWGPRALGNRSIIGDARNPEMQKRLNLKIKYRESFRPFAPSVRYEDLQEYFELDSPSPYMLLVAPVNAERRRALPDGYHGLSLSERLYFLRSDIPAVTHLDHSARIQTVHRETNPRYWQLIQAFKELTGCGVIVNTSFNVRGEPIVCSPEDAYRCFMRTEMDFLVMGDYVFDKKAQPAFKEEKDWKKEYELD